MYDLKPTIDRASVQIDLPTCMYAMKSMNEISCQKPQLSNSQLSNGFNGAESSSQDLGALQKRQSEIIKQLEKLRLKLGQMQAKLGVSEPQKQKKPATVVIKPIDERNLQDIVIHVNPANVPFSLLGLQTLWTDRLNLAVAFFTHSSVKELPAQNKAFEKRLTSTKLDEKIPTLNLSLIWKETPATELVCAPGTFVPITGEANILRYLIRIGPPEFGYIGAGSIQAQMEIDVLLDLTHELIVATAKDHRLAVLKRISQRLNTQTAFGGSSTNVSDIAVFSTIKQLNLTGKELPANVNTWLQRNKSLIQV